MRLRSSVGPVTGSHIPLDSAAQWRRIGEILAIPPDGIQRVEMRQAETGALFGEVAVDLGLATEDDIRRAIEIQQGFAVLAHGDERVEPLVVAAFDPDDPFAALARDVRGILTAATRGDRLPVQAVAVIGVGEHMTESALFAASLAVVCAQAGRRTLLVDAAIGSARQHALFRVANRAGLSGALSARSRVENYIQPTAIPALSLLAAGPDVPNAPELLERQRLSAMLEDLRDAFEFIIVDAGDVAAIQTAAASGLDGAIIIARRDATETKALRSLVDTVRSQGTHVLGTVLID